jgi:hypothetical protein
MPLPPPPPAAFDLGTGTQGQIHQLLDRLHLFAHRHFDAIGWHDLNFQQ